MRFLFAIPHHFAPDGIGYHGSTGPDPRPRQEASFIGPLESAATLALMRSFPIYKPALDCADFLEIEHQDDRFMRVVAGLPPNRGAGPQKPRPLS